MLDHEPGQATPHEILIAQLLDSNVPKSEREWAAAREIEGLRDLVVVLEAMLGKQPEEEPLC